MLEIIPELDDLTLLEVLHPVAPTNALVYLTIDAARAKFGGWALLDEKSTDGFSCYLMSNATGNYYIAMTDDNEAKSKLLICVPSCEEGQEFFAAQNALFTLFDQG